MNGRIRRIDYHWDVVGDPGRAAATALPLERMARDAIPAALEEALDELLGDDPTVYVVRRARMDMVWAGDGSLDALAAAWARLLARSILRTIAASDRDGVDLVRFADEADFSGRFLVDLLAGDAWDRWFYGAFADLRHLSAQAAVNAVLRRAGAHASAVLGVVHRLGALPALLAVVNDDTLRRLWLQARAGGAGHEPSDAPDDRAGQGALPSVAPAADDSPLWPVFLAALRVADRLGLWRGAKPPVDEVWRDFLGTRPLPPSWRDRRELARGLLLVLAFLDESGALDLSRWSPARLAIVLTELDWLDTDLLRAGLHALLRPPPPISRARRGGATSRQRELLADVLHAVRDGAPGADRADPAAAALLVHAVLAAAVPRWRDDDMAKAMIDHLLAAARCLRTDPSPTEAAQRLRTGDADGALARLPAGGRAAAEPAYRFLSRLGSEAVLAALSLASPRRAPASARPAGVTGLEVAGTSIAPTTARPGAEHAEVAGVDALQTECAGVFLLLRAALDVRLAELAEVVGYPPGGVVLASLALRWGGPRAATHGRVDPALAFLPGLSRGVVLEDLHAAWAATPRLAHRRWRAALAQRLDLPGRGDAARALPALAAGRLGVPAADAAMGTTAIALLRAWARWLRGFSDSSVPFVLERFVRRSGYVARAGEDVVVRLERRPLDVVLRLAGYLDVLQLRPLGARGTLRLEVSEP